MPSATDDDVERLRADASARKRRLRMFGLALLALPAALAGAAWAYMVRMPGRSHEGPLPALTPGEAAYQAETARHVQVLAGDIGERNHRQRARLDMSAEYIVRELSAAGYEVDRQRYDALGASFENPVVELSGTELPEEIVVVGAHYDAAQGAPAANDNGSGVAAVLALARAFAGKPQRRTLRFVAFANEEPPHFQTSAMGSLHYAEGCKARGERVIAMLSLETMGYFSDEPRSQDYPFPFSAVYPDTGNFIAIVGDLSSRALVHRVIESFRENARFPSEGAAIPASIPGAGWSDHWSFWQYGYPAVMITDTAPFRYPHYHTKNDTPDKLDYERLARVVAGIEHVLMDLLN
jgi:Zn-dependent M28 family amino/carboxypeptidase